ncbi:MAG: hypothetical protein ACHQX1_03445, partial [Candidatus Micrarchaeales archaeon]
MKLEKYKWTVIYPFSLWFFFKVVALIFGFSDYPDVSHEMLLDDTAPFLPMLFGFWIGAASYGSGLLAALRNTIVVVFLIGGIATIFLLFLINNSPDFVTYASSIYANAAT